jgi:hypothetical protein
MFATILLPKGVLFWNHYQTLHWLLFGMFSYFFRSAQIDIRYISTFCCFVRVLARSSWLWTCICVSLLVPSLIFLFLFQSIYNRSSAFSCFCGSFVSQPVAPVLQIKRHQYKRKTKYTQNSEKNYQKEKEKEKLDVRQNSILNDLGTFLFKAFCRLLL